jgi:mannose-6-phosphate isomerase class I
MTYHWGKKGLDSVVGQAYLQSVFSVPEGAELYEEANHEHYAELWIGDHPNGPAEVLINKFDPQMAKIVGDDDFLKKHHNKNTDLSELFKSNPERFLGRAYLDKFASD